MTGIDTEIDIDHLRGWIGREEVAQELLTDELVRRFRATLGLADEGGVPRLIHLCLAPPVAEAAKLGPDGHPARGGFLPPVPLPNRMWAGGAFVFHADPRVGDRVTRRSRIADVTAKQGRSGPLCFVTVAHRIETPEGLIAQERHDIVYRGPAAAPATGGGADPAPDPAPAGRDVASVDASPVMLFRYSAITFNGHRIHYDRDYATGVEGYPGLVVHGPLQATLLYHFAARLRGAPPARFEFRSLSPLFDTVPVQLHADPAGQELALWTAAPGGPVAMRATAAWD